MLAVLAGAGFLGIAWRSALDPTEPPDAAAFDPALVAEGAELAAIGNCISCHQAAGGEPFAGGYPMATPFGTIYGTNITPHPETGIGRWSEEAFARAMREGVDREGRHLYPAFPYDHFTQLSDADTSALYAFLMTRAPVEATAPPNDLPFPLDNRLLLAGWKLLFFDAGRFEPEPGESEAWNRGAYLVDGLGHCGACHTPRNALGAEIEDSYLAGGVSEGWHGPALNADAPAPVPWTAESLAAYLRDGWHPLHGAAAGPMQKVTQNLSQADGSDADAMGAYLATLLTEGGGEPPVATARALSEGSAPSGGAPPPSADEALFAGACLVCHQGPASEPFARGASLALATSVHLPDARNFLEVVLHGIHPPEGEAGFLMPGFGDALTDEQVVSLATYVRGRFSDEPAWTDLEETVRRTRAGDDGT